MNNEHINTYCNGFQLVAIKNISKKEFIELCNDLQNEFNNYYSTNDYSFSPECITEGGIVFNNFNGDINGYKTIRIYFTEHSKHIKSYHFVSKCMILYDFVCTFLVIKKH